MMYPYMTLNDDTEITHSEMKEDGRVMVYVEKPDEKDCFHHMTLLCILIVTQILPEYGAGERFH